MSRHEGAPRLRPASSFYARPLRAGLFAKLHPETLAALNGQAEANEKELWRREEVEATEGRRAKQRECFGRSQASIEALAKEFGVDLCDPDNFASCEALALGC